MFYYRIYNYEIGIRFTFEAKVDRDVSMSAGVISSALGDDLVSHKVKSYPSKILETIKEVKK